MGLSPLLSGWWVLILVGVVGLLLLGGAAIYLLMQPTKSSVRLPAPAPAPVAQLPQTSWYPAPVQILGDAPPMTMPMGAAPVAPLAPPPPFQSPDQTVPLAALTGEMLGRMSALAAPAPAPAPVLAPPPMTTLASPTSPPPSTSKPSSSKAPLPLRAHAATLASATAVPPALPKPRPPLRTLPPPGSRVHARPFSLAAMGPKKAAEVLALQLDSDLPPAMRAPDAPDTERSLEEEDDAPTMATTWEAMSATTRRGSA